VLGGAFSLTQLTIWAECYLHKFPQFLQAQRVVLRRFSVSSLDNETIRGIRGFRFIGPAQEGYLTVVFLLTRLFRERRCTSNCRYTYRQLLRRLRVKMG